MWVLEGQAVWHDRPAWFDTEVVNRTSYDAGGIEVRCYVDGDQVGEELIDRLGEDERHPLRFGVAGFPETTEAVERTLTIQVSVSDERFTVSQTAVSFVVHPNKHEAYSESDASWVPVDLQFTVLDWLERKVDGSAYVELVPMGEGNQAATEAEIVGGILRAQLQGPAAGSVRVSYASHQLRVGTCEAVSQQTYRVDAAGGSVSGYIQQQHEDVQLSSLVTHEEITKDGFDLEVSLGGEVKADYLIFEESATAAAKASYSTETSVRDAVEKGETLIVRRPVTRSTFTLSSAVPS